MSRIQSDVNRFRQIVRGRVREELRKHLGQHEMVGRQGKRMVSIPVPQLELPRFVHDDGGQGVGQGDGEGDGQGAKAGNDPGAHALEAEFTVEELAQMLGEALELPRIEPKGHDELQTTSGRYTGISNVGPESLRHFRRSYRQALRRVIAAGAYDPQRPRIVLDRADKRYRTWKPRTQPSANAVIVYVMDVSGSMGADQKELVRTESFWLDAWIASHYEGTRSIYIVHDAAAKEVDRDTFFRIRESGGTVISSAYELALQIIKERFPVEDWNLYLFHFTDGENYSRQDTEKCMEMLAEQILPQVNLFGYGQVESYGTSGDFFDYLRKRFSGEEKVALSRIPDRDAIVGSIKLLLGEGSMRLKALPTELVEAQARIEKIASGNGLDFFRTVFEMVDYQQMNSLAAYGGFPTRYPHYRFGMEYNQLSKSYEYGLHKIYEMVINNDPTYAYLLEGNSILDQKLVMAHVYGHADFFKHNMYFSHTNRRMIDEMANHATRIRRYQERYGMECVERFIDACLALDELIDPNIVFLDDRRPGPLFEDEPQSDDGVGRMPAKQYMDRYVNPPEYLEEQRTRMEEERSAARRFPPRPERDVLGFVMNHAPLENWERDVVSMLREEAYYFLPQRQTKVMNEGWASYWHSKMMTTSILTDAEVIDYADHHSGTVATQPGRLNPYKLGIELFRDIERRWNMGQFGPEWDACESMAERANWDRKTGLGRDKIFEIRRVHCDATFLDEFLTPEFCIEQKLFVAKEEGRNRKVVVSSRQFNEIKQALLFQFTNGGRPVIELVDANHANRGELLLTHRHVGVDLRWDWAKEVLGNLVQVWRRPVRLETTRGGKPIRIGHDGKGPSEERIEGATEAKAS